ncbi:MAG TPA: hypothetical protein VKU00_20000 [Chthonomonadaceae bacterium]|nr:hypothetical protein [Chthonomonadaceae bacterium]
MAILVTAVSACVANAQIRMDTTTGLPGFDSALMAGDQFHGNIVNGMTPVGGWTITVTGVNNPIGLFGSTTTSEQGAVSPRVNPGANFMQLDMSFDKTWNGVTLFYDGNPPNSTNFFTPDDKQTFTLSGGAVWDVISSTNLNIVGAGTNTITLTTTGNPTYEIAPSAPISGLTFRFDNLDGQPNGTTTVLDFSDATVAPESGSVWLILPGLILVSAVAVRRYQREKREQPAPQL